VFNPRVGLWAAALFYSTPLVSWLSGNTYTDLPVALFLLATLLAFLRWRETRQIAWLLATGFLGGAAVSTKLTALFGLPVIGLLVAIDLLVTPQLSASSKVRAMAGCALAASLVAAPYFLIAYTFFRNPFFPLLNGLVFGTSLDPALNLNGDLGSFSLGYSPLVFLRLPFASTFDGQDLGRGTAAGGLGISLAVLPLACLIRRKAAPILLAICAVFLALLCYTMPGGRYYISVLPVVVVLAIAALLDISSVAWLKRLTLACLGAGLIAQATVIPLTYWNIPDRVPLSLALGAETQEAFLTRALPLYRAVQYLNRNSLPGKKIFSVGGEQMRFYLQSPMAEAQELGPDFLRGSTIPEAASSLAREGFGFLFADGDFPPVRHSRQVKRRLFRPPPYLREAFLTQYAVLEYASGNAYVYRLRETAAQPAGETNLLTNPSFELKNSAGLPVGWQVYGRAPQILDDAARAHTGQISVLADSSGGLVNLVPVQGDKVYSLGHWARSDLPKQDGRLQINWLDANLKLIETTISLFRATTTWTWHQVTASAPPGASFAHIYVSVHENGKVIFDDYVFVPGELQAPK
jgi:hypothetical protein